MRGRVMYKVHYIFIFPNGRTKRGLDLLTHQLLDAETMRCQTEMEISLLRMD
jgi:hypothetical protein